MRKVVITLCLAMLAACQTVPAKSAFSAAQVAALTDAGFKPVGENFELGISDRVLFAVDQSDLVPETASVITRLATTFGSVGIHGAAVEGHTDSTGASAYNQALSERRAVSVKAELVRSGMAEAEVRTTGLGETRPIGDNATDEGRAQNRRVVIVVTPTDAAPVR